MRIHRATGLVLLIAVVVAVGHAQSSDSAGPLEDFDFVWRAISEWYVEPDYGGVGWDAIHDDYRLRVQRASDQDGAYNVIGEMLAELGNTTTFVIPPALVPALRQQAEQQGPAEQEYAGVGILIAETDGPGVAVLGTFREAPAEKAGVLLGDVLVGVNGYRFTDDDDTQAVTNRVRGPVGSDVTLTLRDPDGVERQVTITRGRIDLRPSVETRVVQRTIGYIRVPSLSMDLIQQVSRALPSLLSTQGIVLDLRGVPGGSPDAMAVLAQWFLGPTPIGAVVTREERHAIPYSPDAIAAYRGHLVVLTDSRTSGVAEVLAAALRDAGRSRIVGTVTRGGSQIASIVEMPSGGLLQIAIANYTTARGTVLRDKGITPDIELVPPDLATLRAGRDPHLDRAIEVIRSGGRI